MMITAATELGPNQWIGNLLQNLVGIQGILLLIYTAGITGAMQVATLVIMTRLAS